MTSTKIDQLIQARGDKARAALLNTHPCNVLCDGGTHVDLVYVNPETAASKGDRLEADIKARYEWLHEVTVLDARRVEAPPPAQNATLTPLAGGVDRDPESVTIGVWWRLP